MIPEIVWALAGPSPPENENGAGLKIVSPFVVKQDDMTTSRPFVEKIPDADILRDRIALGSSGPSSSSGTTNGPVTERDT